MWIKEYFGVTSSLTTVRLYKESRSEEATYYRPRTSYEERLCFDTCLSICQSVCPHLGRVPSQVQLGGVPQPGPPGGSPNRGIPHLGYPPIKPGREYLIGGTPPWVPPIRPGQGYPNGGNQQGSTPPQVPLCDLAGGTLMGAMGSTPSRVVLHTLWSVCLSC